MRRRLGYVGYIRLLLYLRRLFGVSCLSGART